MNTDLGFTLICIIAFDDRALGLPFLLESFGNAGMLLYRQHPQSPDTVRAAGWGSASVRQSLSISAMLQWACMSAHVHTIHVCAAYVLWWHGVSAGVVEEWERESSWLGEEFEAADRFFDPTSFRVLPCTSAFCKGHSQWMPLYGNEINIWCVSSMWEVLDIWIYLYICNFNLSFDLSYHY